MKKVNVNFEGTTDTTGYLFSLAKSLSATLRCSKYHDYADDIVASSGFAFRMWVNADLCPSATSIWEFKMQKPWIESGGLVCDYVERLWGEENFEQERRISAIDKIKKSIDSGVAAVAWDISGCEWGIVTGYDDEANTLFTLKVNGCEDSIPYEKLGRLDLPILSVLTVIGKTEKPSDQIIADTKRLAASHLRGAEWCDNAKGLAAYDTLIQFINERLNSDTAWNLEYYLGTYAALKWYGWKFFEKYNESGLAQIYETVYHAWSKAFALKRLHDVTDTDIKKQIGKLLQAAKEAEMKAVGIMSEL